MSRKWIVFGTALLAYILAMLHRASLGVAGVEAAQHFHSTPGIVSTFVVLQLAVYALAQVPVGTLLDRYGARRIITVGCLIMAVGQALLGSVDVLPLAYLARVLVGLGDACMYISILALIPQWFAPQLAPLLAQAAGFLSVFGQLAAIYGLRPLIQARGWEVGLLVAASVTVGVAAASWALVRDAPHPVERRPARITDVNRGLLDTLGHPGTQLGFFIHFSCGFSMNAFVFMWGLPYLQQAHGLSESTASLMFTLITVSGIVFAPLIGILTARYPLRRSNLALTVVWAGLIGWLLVLAQPQPAPVWMILLLVLALAAGGPGTAVGFDFPRTELPQARLGVANGIVLSGGFLGATATILVIGLVLEVISGGASQYTFDQWRLAMALQMPFYGLGIAGILISRARLRRRMREAGVIVPPWWDAVGRRWRRLQRRRR